MADEPIDIFISYSRRDAAFADILASNLQSRGYNTWVDRHRLAGGQRWRRELQDAIDRARAVVVLLSPDAIVSETVQAEYGYALDEGKVVIPLLYRECKVPMELRVRQLTTIEEQGFERGFDDLLASLTSHALRPSDGPVAPALPEPRTTPALPLLGAPASPRSTVREPDRSSPLAALGWLFATVLLCLVVVVGSVALLQWPTSPTSTLPLALTAGIVAVAAFLPLSLWRASRQEGRATRQAIRALSETLTDALAARPAGAVTVDPTTSVAVFAGQADAYRALEAYANTHTIQRAVLIQYSGISSRALLRTLLRNGASVTLYVQDEATARAIGSIEQAERIEVSLRFLPGELAELYRPDRLTIRKYQPPASISAVRIDDALLCMGWYTYEYVDDANRLPMYPADSAQISGHDIAAVLAEPRSLAFQTLDSTFQLIERNLAAHARPVSLS